uniref:Uncharacterized protein n=1 Tax=Amphimedon queenslandica TaxID=400682 RepID=A0A1X7TDI9_AMPQE
TVPEAPLVEEKGHKKVECEPTPPPPGTEDISDLSLDTQLIVHSYNTALVLASKLLSKEIRFIEEAAAEVIKLLNVPPFPAQLAIKQKMENTRREHTAALKHEEKILVDRLKLIKEKAVHLIDHLKIRPCYNN